MLTGLLGRGHHLPRMWWRLRRLRCSAKKGQVAVGQHDTSTKPVVYAKAPSRCPFVLHPAEGPIASLFQYRTGAVAFLEAPPEPAKQKAQAISDTVDHSTPDGTNPGV